MASETAKATIYLEGKQAEAALDSLSRRGKQLKKDFNEAQKAGDNIKMNKLEKELRGVESAQRSLRKESFDTQKVLQNMNGSSFNDLTKALKQSQRELKRMAQTDAGYKNKLSEVISLKSGLADLSRQQQVSVPFWSKLANGANKYFNVITLGIASITGVLFSFSQFVKGMVGLDDALADVMKTTGLTSKEVRLMYQDFRNLNTRTPRAELLALAEEAGRLGMTGKKNIMEFVEVANKIKISLGDDLGGNAEEAIREVGKLTQIFKVGNQYNTDYKTSLEKVGSGLNQVANNSNASAGYLIEYMKRLGGISDQSKITAADIMGYASVFDQLGQNVEMAATAQSKIIVDMFTDPGKYARIAKMEVGDFSKLLKTDANEAFIKFLEGLNGNNEGLSVMATKLDALGIDGARATQALAALSSNTKMLREQQDLANKSMSEGTSLQKEYEIKNNNLAGSWAKLTAFIQAKFINSNFISFLEKVIGKMSEWTEVTHPLTKALRDEVTQVTLLTTELTNTNTPAERRNEIYAELQRIAPDVVANIDKENISLSTLRTNLEQYNQAMIKKIALQDSEETLADKRKAAGEATARRLESEEKVMKRLEQLLTAQKSWNPENVKKIEEIMVSNLDIIEKYNQIDKLFAQGIGGGNLTDKIVTAREDEKAAYDAVTESLDVYMQRYEKVFGKAEPIVPVITPPGVKTPGGGGLTGDEAKKASEKAIEALDAANNERTAKLITQYETEGWSDAKFKAEMLAAEQAYLIMKQALLQQFGQSTIDVDNQINQKRIEAQKQLNSDLKAGMDSAEKDHESSMKLFDETEELSIDNLAKQTLQSLSDLEKAKDEEKRILEERQQNYLNFAMSAGQEFGQLMLDNEATMADYLKATLNMALEAFHQFFLIEKAKAIIAGAGKGPLGMVAAVGKVIAMEIAYQAVKAALTKKGKAEGGYTAPGGKYEPAGIVHAGEYVIPQDGVNNAALRPVIDLMEIARQNGSLARLDLRPVVTSIGGGKGYSSGGSTSTLPDQRSMSKGSFGGNVYSGLSSSQLNRLNAILDRLESKDFSIAVETYERKRTRYDEMTKGGLK